MTKAEEKDLFGDLLSDFRESILSTIFYPSQNPNLWNDYQFICNDPEKHFETVEYINENPKLFERLVTLLVKNRIQRNYASDKYPDRDLKALVSLALSDFCCDVINHLDQDFLFPRIHINHYRLEKVRANNTQLRKQLEQLSPSNPLYQKTHSKWVKIDAENEKLADEWDELYEEFDANYEAMFRKWEAIK